MDTTYYTFQPTKIKASGGAELVTFIPSLQPEPKTDDATHTGEVLNFDLCRRRLETRAAWKDLAAMARNAGEVEPPQETKAPVEALSRRPVPAHARKRQPRNRAPWVDILTSALALALVCVVGAVAMLSIV